MVSSSSLVVEYSVLLQDFHTLCYRCGFLIASYVYVPCPSQWTFVPLLISIPVKRGKGGGDLIKHTNTFFIRISIEFTF